MQTGTRRLAHFLPFRDQAAVGNRVGLHTHLEITLIEHEAVRPHDALDMVRVGVIGAQANRILLGPVFHDVALGHEVKAAQATTFAPRRADGASGLCR